MRAGQGVCNLDRDLQRLSEAHPFALDELVKRLAGDELHHDEVRTAVRGDVVDVDDVGVIVRSPLWLPE